MNQTTIMLLMDKIANIENRCHAIESAFIDYMEKAPKPDGQWIEERLRALESQNQFDIEDDENDEDDKESKLISEIFYINDKVNNLVQELETFQAKIEREDPWQKIASLNQSVSSGGDWMQGLQTQVNETFNRVLALESMLNNVQQMHDERLSKIEMAVAENKLALENIAKQVLEMCNEIK